MTTATRMRRRGAVRAADGVVASYLWEVSGRRSREGARRAPAPGGGGLRRSRGATAGRHGTAAPDCEGASSGSVLLVGGRRGHRDGASHV